jgi:MFS family permease
MLIAAIGGIGMWAYVLVLPAVEADFDVDRAGASLPFTLTMVGFAFGNFMFGRLVDRVGIVPPMIIGAVALGAGFVLAAMSAAIWQFAIIHGLLIGIGMSVTFGPLIADVSHWFDRRRGIAVAATATGNYVAGTVWPTILQGFVETDGWRATYMGIGVACVATMVPLVLLLRRRAPGLDHAGLAEPAVVPPPLAAIDLSPRALQILLAIAGVGCCVAMSMPQVHIVAYCVELGFGPARGAEMLSLMLAGGLASRLVSGFLADYIGGIRTLLLGSVLQCVGLLLYLPFDGLVSLYVVSLVFGLSQGGIVPSYVIIVREYLPAREAGQRVGLVIMATIVGMAIGGWLSGWIYDLTGSYQAAFLNGIAWNVLNISIMAAVLWRTRGPTAVAA